MKRVHPSRQFKKDLKRYSNKPEKLAALTEIVDLLIAEKPIPKEYKPHTLKGKYNGYMECHIEDDFLLIWIESDMIDLVRIGTHSNLFD